MQNKIFLKNNKAVAPIVGAVVIVAILVVVGIFAYQNYGGSKPYWETETDFGMWQDELFITFEDGTEQSLKLIDESGLDQKTFTVKYGTKVIDEIGIRIRAMATGTGYSGALLQYDDNFGSAKVIKYGSLTKYSAVGKLPDGTTREVPMGSNTAILTTSLKVNNIIKGDYPSGIYFAIFTPQGTVRYKGYPDIPGEPNDWKTASLPPARNAALIVTQAPAGSITVTLSSEIFTS